MKANMTHAPDTKGDSLSPIIAAFFTVPLNPCVYSVLMAVGDHALRYEQVQMKSTTTIRKASKLNKADYKQPHSCQWQNLQKKFETLTMFDLLFFFYNYSSN